MRGVNGEKSPAPEGHPQHPEHQAFVTGQRTQRLAKLDVLRERGIDPYSLDLIRPDAVNGAALSRVGALQATVAGFLRVPLVARLLVPSVPSDGSGAK